MTNPAIRIHQQPRRSLAMKLTPVGVVVFIPRWLHPESKQVRAFIAAGLKQFGLDAPPQHTATMTADELRTLVREWAARMDVQPARVQIRDMYRKWGSCSRRGTVTLNSALCTVPFALAEYVVCHELAHLREFNHGKDFKALMTCYMPDWRERSRALDQILRPGTPR